MAFIVVDRPLPGRLIADPGDAIVRKADAVRTEAEPPVRPVYRHSVVPGGVRSPEEIEQAMNRDKVVAEHYKDIDPALMRNERLEKPLLAHVSYRLGDNVYWTRKPVQLPVNEPILTDGTNMIRERCGNLISMDPLAPASDEEPPAPSFDLLIDPIEFQWMPLYYTPPARLGIGPPPAAPPPPGIGPRGTPFSAPPRGTPRSFEAPLPVPEPGTLTMVGLAGAAGLAHYVRLRLRARRRK